MIEIEVMRLYADENGVSHFGTTTVELEERDFAPPAPPLQVSEVVEARQGFLRAPAGWFGDWHPTPARQFMCILSGSVEVSVSDGETRQFGPGAVVLLDDRHGKGHATRVLGDEAALMMFAQVG